MNVAESHLREMDSAYIWHPYSLHTQNEEPLPVERGQGAWLFLPDKRALLDGISSWWTNLHGHAHPYITRSVHAQLRELHHVMFSAFTHGPAARFGELLLQILPGNQSKVFYSESGSSAVETAVLLALTYAHQKYGGKKKKLLVLENGFHGTFLKMGIREQWVSEELRFNVATISAPYPGQEAASMQSLEAVLKDGDVFAILYEPMVQGTKGMQMYSVEAGNQMLEKCRTAGVLLIADEVMTGFGRTGKNFGSDHFETGPDLVCMSKGLTGGTLPMGATTCSEAVFSAFKAAPYSRDLYQSHSFSGNPLACTAALASLELLLAEDTPRDLERITQAHATFAEKVRHHPNFSAIRQCGTILALEWKIPEGKTEDQLATWLYRFFLSKNVLLHPLGKVLYIMPPYCIQPQELEQIYNAVNEALAVTVIL